MVEVVLFCEDVGHELVLRALICRTASAVGCEVDLQRRSVRGGRGKALAEMAEFARDLRGSVHPLPDLLVVAIDANCHGYVTRRDEALKRVGDVGVPLVVAAPDPHVERWLLADSAAFKAVLGRGCRAPDTKCDRDRYKSLLADAVRECGVQPVLGGLEHAEEIVAHMDLDRAPQIDKSLGRFIDELRAALREVAGRPPG